MIDLTKRKLKNGQREKAFMFAVTKFVDAEARAAEDKAEADFVDAFMTDYEREFTGHTDFLLRHNVGLNLDRVMMPDFVPVTSEGKTFIRPDGKEVKREGKLATYPAAMQRFTKESRHLPLAKIREYVGGDNRPVHRSSYHSYGYREPLEKVKLPRTVVLPAATNYKAGAFSYNLQSKPQSVTFRFNSSEAPWISKTTLNRLRDFFLAAGERQLAEDKLHRAIGSIIMTVPTYGELIEVWPEVRLIEDELFPEAPAKVQPLTVINDEVKAMLCQNMAERGVEASICKAA